MSIHPKEDGVWKTVSFPYIKKDGSWIIIQEVWYKQNGIWEKIFPDALQGNQVVPDRCETPLAPSQNFKVPEPFLTREVGKCQNLNRNPNINRNVWAENIQRESLDRPFNVYYLADDNFSRYVEQRSFQKSKFMEYTEGYDFNLSFPENYFIPSKIKQNWQRNSKAWEFDQNNILREVPADEPRIDRVRNENISKDKFDNLFAGLRHESVNGLLAESSATNEFQNSKDPNWDIVSNVTFETPNFPGINIDKGIKTNGQFTDWTTETFDSEYDQIIASDNGDVFVIVHESGGPQNVNRLDQNGNLKWSASPPFNFYDDIIYNEPDDSLIFPSDEPSIKKTSADGNFTEDWSLGLPSTTLAIFQSPNNGEILVTYDNNLRAIDINGTLLWDKERIIDTFQIAFEGTHFYGPISSSGIGKFDVTTGNIVDQVDFSTLGSVNGTTDIAASNGVVYLLDNDKVVQLSSSDLSVNWTYDFKDRSNEYLLYNSVKIESRDGDVYVIAGQIDRRLREPDIAVGHTSSVENPIWKLNKDGSFAWKRLNLDRENSSFHAIGDVGPNYVYFRHGETANRIEKSNGDFVDSNISKLEKTFNIPDDGTSWTFSFFVNTNINNADLEDLQAVVELHGGSEEIEYGVAIKGNNFFERRDILDALSSKEQVKYPNGKVRDPQDLNSQLGLPGERSRVSLTVNNNNSGNDKLTVSLIGLPKLTGEFDGFQLENHSKVEKDQFDNLRSTQESSPIITTGSKFTREADRATVPVSLNSNHYTTYALIEQRTPLSYPDLHNHAYLDINGGGKQPATGLLGFDSGLATDLDSEDKDRIEGLKNDGVVRFVADESDVTNFNGVSQLVIDPEKSTSNESGTRFIIREINVWENRLREYEKTLHYAPINYYLDNDLNLRNFPSNKSTDALLNDFTIETATFTLNNKCYYLHGSFSPSETKELRFAGKGKSSVIDLKEGFFDQFKGPEEDQQIQDKISNDVITGNVSEREKATSSEANNKAYVYTKFNRGDPDFPKNDSGFEIYEYDLNSDDWSHLAGQNESWFPTQSLFVEHNDRLYLLHDSWISSFRNDVTDDPVFVAYDLSMGQFVSLATAPTSPLNNDEEAYRNRASHAQTVIDDVIYYAGKDGRFFSYDINSDSWNILNDIPNSGSAGPQQNLFDVDGDVYAPAGQLTSDRIYDTDSNTWSTVPNSHSPVDDPSTNTDIKNPHNTLGWSLSGNRFLVAGDHTQGTNRQAQLIPKPKRKGWWTTSYDDALFEKTVDPNRNDTDIYNTHEPVSSIPSFRVQNELYAVGDEKIFHFDFTASVWKVKENPPTNFFAGTGVSYSNDGYLVGGMQNQNNCEIYRYDTSNDSWSQITIHPSSSLTNSSLIHGESVEVSGEIYIFGGYAYDGSTYSRLDEVWKYDINSDNWTQLSSMNNGGLANQSSHGSTVFNGNIHMVGDKRNTPVQSPDSSFGSYQTYDISSDTWTTEPQTSIKVSDCIVGAIDGELWVVDGTTESGRVDPDVQVFRNGSWVKFSNTFSSAHSSNALGWEYKNEIYRLGGEDENGFKKTAMSKFSPSTPSSGSSGRVVDDVKETVPELDPSELTFAESPESEYIRQFRVGTKVAKAEKNGGSVKALSINIDALKPEYKESRLEKNDSEVLEKAGVKLVIGSEIKRRLNFEYKGNNSSEFDNLNLHLDFGYGPNSRELGLRRGNATQLYVANQTNFSTARVRFSPGRHVADFNYNKHEGDSGESGTLFFNNWRLAPHLYPPTLEVDRVDGSTVNISVSVREEDVSGDLSNLGGYKIYRSIKGQDNFTEVQDISSSSESETWTDNSVVPGTKYIYKASIYSFDGLETDMSYSTTTENLPDFPNFDNFELYTYPDRDNIVQGMPNGFKVTDRWSSSGSYSLVSHPIPDNSTAKVRIKTNLDSAKKVTIDYRVRSGDGQLSVGNAGNDSGSNTGTFTQKQEAGKTTISATFTKTTGNTGSEDRVYIDNIRVTGPVFDSPTISVTRNSDTEVSGTVGISSTNFVSSLKLYEIHRSVSGQDNFSKIQEITSSSSSESFTDTGLNANTSYDYKVRIVDVSDTAGPFSDIATAPLIADGGQQTDADLVWGLDQIGPELGFDISWSLTQEGVPGSPTSTPVPENLSTTVDDQNDGVIINWNVSNETTISEYVVFRADTSNGSFSEIARVASKSYNDNSIQEGETKYYKIKSVSLTGKTSNFSNEVSGELLRITNLQGVQNLNDNVDLTWDTNQDVNVTYNVYWAPKSGGSFTKLTSGLNSKSYTDTGVQIGETNYYKVSAVLDKSGVETSLTNEVSVTLTNKIFVEDFESDLSAWSVNNNSFEIKTDEVFNGSQSGGIQDTGTSTHLYATHTLRNAQQIGEFEFAYWETSDQPGGGVRLFNSNGNQELGIATNNPQWIFAPTKNETDIIRVFDGTDDPNGFGNAVYQVWHTVNLVFDWNNNEVTWTWKNTRDNIEKTGTQSIQQGVDVAEIRLHSLKGFGGEAWSQDGFPAAHMRYDDIKVFD